MSLLAQLEAKVEELMLKHQRVINENLTLREEVHKLSAKNNALKETNRLIESQSDNLEMIKKIAINSGNSEQTKRELNRLVSEIDECIQILEATHP